MPESTGTLVEGVSGRIVAQRLRRAVTSRDRSVGLLGRFAPEESDALWFSDCSAIHTWFMRFPIDVAFVDKGGRIVKAYQRLAPWRIAIGGLRSRHVVELAAGTLERTRIGVGDVLLDG